MPDWKNSVDEFLISWNKLNYFEGAILSGSYAVGTQSEYSDIDIMIVLSDDTRWWQRGNQIVNGFMIEYIADPFPVWEKSFDDDFNSGRKVSVNMFAIGKVLFDKKGKVAELKEKAGLIMKKPFENMKQREVEMAKYQLYDGINKLRNLSNDDFYKNAPLYYLQLTKIINFYARFLGISVPATAKLDKFLNDSDFRNNYQLSGFDDKEFLKLVNSSLKDYSSLDSIKNLTSYVLDKLGGFELNGWVLKTDI